MARAFDLISAEYKVTDQYILDLPIRRVRQMQAAIFQRMYLRDRMRRSEISWAVRMVSQIIAIANTETSKEGVNELAQIANTFDMDDPPSPPSRDDQPSPATANNGEPKQGSFEKFMTMFGGAMG